MSKMTMRLVYVATPYSGLRGVSEINRPFLARKIAKNACEMVKKAGYMPISPVLAFSEIFDEQKDREHALKAGLELLSHCSYAYFYDLHPDSHLSEGMKKEREYARELGITELDLDGGFGF
ncbi:DUF4406 domain-containing protein [Campylobacter gastrosuis]|uniref:Sugar phosphate isomerase/epimerase n=1 Tax=Campylobacter gastrosuis TaxID=2974576 RepID=A0ABT7HRD2_9BACT|nr:DUF4406 domain-containing protein [Campylobacter gastrosuis]MDL0089270.1 sugar phosphate isomerase/epimerase [Campylobacter gastrosuis]